jgi:hypothetical protein
MTRQRERHEKRTPIEEKARLQVLDLVGKSGTVYVERSGFDELDSVLIRVADLDGIADGEFERLKFSLVDLLNVLLPENSSPSCCALVVRAGQETFLRP